MALNVGYMWTTYHDYTKKMDNYCGTGLPGQNVYSRTNKVFGLSFGLRFLSLKNISYPIEKREAACRVASFFLIHGYSTDYMKPYALRLVTIGFSRCKA